MYRVICFASAVLFVSMQFSVGQADHNLREIERRCEVYKYSGNYGELDCSSSVSDRRSLERKCEVYFSGSYGEFDCSGSHFNDVERRCEAYLYSGNYAEIDC